MKKNMNFVVPCGYVGYSKLTSRVYMPGKFINPFTVSLIDISTKIVRNACEDQFRTQWEPCTVKIEYEVSYSPVDIKAYVAYFGEAVFKQWINCVIDDVTARYLCNINVYEIMSQQPFDDDEVLIEASGAIIRDSIKEKIVKEIVDRAATSFPFLKIAVRVNSIGVKL